MLNKCIELFLVIKEDKKLTAFLEKRFKEYERDLTCSESVQCLKDEIEVSTYILESILVSYLKILYYIIKLTKNALNILY